jgi:SAM-dependent methyltransferase
MGHRYNRDLAYIQAVGFAKSAERAAPEIVRILKNAPIEVRRVVDVGCGAGPLTRALIEAGFEVTGIDHSEELLEFARKAAPAARFVHASAYDAPLGPCDAILAINEPLTYHAEGADADRLIRRFFQRAAEALPVHGMLIFDVIELGEPSLAGRFWASGDDWAVLVKTTEDQGSRILVRNIETFRRVGETYRRGREVHCVRLFDTSTLCGCLAASGFTAETAQYYGSQPLLPRRRAFFAIRTS